VDCNGKPTLVWEYNQRPDYGLTRGLIKLLNLQFEIKAELQCDEKLVFELL
jgi:hypothetical protein